MLTEELRREQVKIGYDSYTWLKNFSKNKDYQYHLKDLVDLIKITEMELSIYKFRANARRNKETMNRDNYINEAKRAEIERNEE